MSKEKEEKPASNFELNLIKIGVHRFQLHKGDRFTTNGAYFAYQPSTAENKKKLPFSNYHKHTTISAEKHKKDVLRAENIKLVIDRPLAEGSESRYKEYEVQYAYEVPDEERDPLMCIGIELSWKYVDLDKNNEKNYFWKITHTEMVVERETKMLYFVKDSPSGNYMNQIDKKVLNIVQTHYSQQFIVCKIEDAIEMEHKLVEYVEELQKSRIENAKQVLAETEKNLNRFYEFKKTVGY